VIPEPVRHRAHEIRVAHWESAEKFSSRFAWTQFTGPCPPSLFDGFPEFFENFVTVEQRAALGLRRATFQPGFQVVKLLVSDTLLAFEQAERFPHDFACSLVASGFDAAVQEGIQFRSNRDVDGGSVRSHSGGRILAHCVKRQGTKVAECGPRPRGCAVSF